ncbi:hypothetical protein HGM15179_022337, partial [Zosterops borbonicus]
SPCPDTANVQQQLHQPLPPAGLGRHTAAAAPALLPLPGHLPGCPPGQRPRHQRRGLRPPPAQPHVLLPAPPGPHRPGLHPHHCPQSHAQFPLGHQEHLLHRMCCTALFHTVLRWNRVLSPDYHVLRPL